MNSNGLILGPYKEPLRRVDGGFGYLGALTFDTLGKVQCHVCGELFDNLAGHISNAHKVTAKQYRTTYGLAATTRLISEKYREEKKNNHLQYLASLSPEQKAEHRRRAYAAITRCNELRRQRIKDGTHKAGNNSLEQKNKRGTCPDQLLQIIRDAHQHFGYTPSQHEFQAAFSCRYNEPIKRTFGSWSAAVKKAGFEDRKGKGGAPKGIARVRHTDEELLDYLAVFYQENNKIPTSGDCNRGLLPSYAAYNLHFGSFPRARELAGIPEYKPNQRSANTLKV